MPCIANRQKKVSIIRDIDQMAVNAANDDEKLSDFIKKHEFYILKTAAKISKHYVSKKDDEGSIVLVAFSDAVKKYDYNKRYGFRFMDLVECSPKAHKTKQACAKAISYIVTNPILVKEMQASKQLPAKLLEKNAGIDRKSVV